MSGPLVSVVVSAYNRPSLLRVALDSVLSQTYQNIEILIQDDSTTDECEALVGTYADQRIRYVHNRPPLGTLRNLVAGYRRCAGQYFSTLNDDDLYLPAYLETMVDALTQDRDSTVAFSDHSIMDGTGTVLERDTVDNSRAFGRLNLTQGRVQDPLRTALLVKAVPGMFALYRKQSLDLDNFPDGVSSAYDYWLTYLAVRNGGSILYTSRRLTSYRVHQESQTSSFADPKKRLVYLRYNEFIDQHLLADRAVRSLWPQVRLRLRETLAAQGFAHLRMEDRRLALHAFRRSISLGLSIKNLSGFVLSFVPGLVRDFVIHAK